MAISDGSCSSTGFGDVLVAAQRQPANLMREGSDTASFLGEDFHSPQVLAIHLSSYKVADVLRYLDRGQACQVEVDKPPP
jgi:hypothetical protein